MGYDLPEAAAMRLEVFDAAGRRVAALVDATQAAGRYEVAWAASGLPSGVYVVQLTAGTGFSATQRVALVR